MENDFSSGYVSSEIFLDSEFHIRLFIQTQTKISFFIKSRNVFEKIADAKLFNSPFSSVIHFINHFEEYKVQIYREKQALQEYQMKQKLAGEFIKSVLITRIGKTGWTLNYCPKDFELCINQDGKIEKYPLSIDSFIPELEIISVLFHSLP
jgi:hypothetical protein